VRECVRESERKRASERERETERQRESDTDTAGERERERARQREYERESECERENERLRERVCESEICEPSSRVRRTSPKASALNQWLSSMKVSTLPFASQIHRVPIPKPQTLHHKS